MFSLEEVRLSAVSLETKGSHTQEHARGHTQIFQEAQAHGEKDCATAEILHNKM